jgi:hypothetical protein
VAEVGAWGGRRDRTDQIRVRHHQFEAPLLISISISISPPGPIRHSYENGIQTFDTADVSFNPILLLILPPPLTDVGHRP